MKTLIKKDARKTVSDNPQFMSPFFGRSLGDIRVALKTMMLSIPHAKKGEEMVSPRLLEYIIGALGMIAIIVLIYMVFKPENAAQVASSCVTQYIGPKFT
ncbi:hypothetical protein COV19_06495 [Candidatus Woesearchaeota archaeon CG10_big_fil_rev_8_21_14_0_10_44_13]|nr:MAG: hypothetical protein COV19_06495 [Candidatus Woesearchaeota archaeon CG10_big_fil_rev_8_21_14_0_10_44_13]